MDEEAALNDVQGDEAVIEKMVARAEGKAPTEEEPAEENNEIPGDPDGDPDEQEPEEASEKPDEEEGDEPEAEEGDEEPDETEPAKTLTVEIDGEEVEVTAEDFRSGSLRMRDYTRKTEELAAKERDGEQRIAALEQTWQSRLALQEQLILSRIPQKTPDELRQMAQNEPEQYVAFLQQRDEAMAQLNQMGQAVQDIQQRQTKEQQDRFDKFKKDQEALIPKMIPEYDGEKGAELRKAEWPKLQRLAKSFDYTAEELEGIGARELKVLRLAMIGSERVEKTKIAKKKAKAAPVKSIKAGAATPTRIDRDAEKVKQLSSRFKKTGSDDDLVDLLLAKSGA
ncbi:MAG: hypothetical protein AAGH60_14405 [Pseudomonadota bacterium]